MILIEIWFHNGIFYDKFCVSNYNVYRYGRSSISSVCTRGSGVISICKCINSQIISCIYWIVEQLFISYEFNDSMLIIGGIYLPPK